MGVEPMSRNSIQIHIYSLVILLNILQMFRKETALNCFGFLPFHPFDGNSSEFVADIGVGYFSHRKVESALKHLSRK